MARQLVRRRKSMGVDGRARGTSPRSHRRHPMTSNPNNSFKACLQFFVISSVIPLLFFLRMTMHHSTTNGYDRIKNDISFLRASLSIPSTLPEPFAFLPELLRNYCTALRKHHKSSSLLDHDLLLGSDVVELHHCRGAFVENSLDWGNFTSWARPLVNTTLQGVESVSPEIQQEFILELLELYLTHHGYCRFDQYHPSFQPRESSAATMTAPLEQTALEKPPVSNDGNGNGNGAPLARLAFVIAVEAAQDNNAGATATAQQVQTLLQAIHMPHHYIILHVAARASPELKQALQELAKEYDNVVVVSFGTILPQTDSMSMIHWKLMKWLTRDMNLKYDYHITLDGSTFPLYSAKELAEHLTQSTHSIWLGTLTENGKTARDAHRKWLLGRQVIATSSSIHKAVPLGNVFRDASNHLPNFLARESLTTKTTSGRFAVFSYDVVTNLVDSPQVRELLALSKYGCCGSLENYNWYAALRLVVDDEKALQEAKSMSSVFQVWGGGVDGGDDNCQNNAMNAQETGVLSLDATRCYRLEYPQLAESIRGNETIGNNKAVAADLTIPRDRLIIRGDEDTIMAYLRHAKQLGFLFARQFDSSNPKSVAARDAVQAMWEAS